MNHKILIIGTGAIHEKVKEYLRKFKEVEIICVSAKQFIEHFEMNRFEPVHIMPPEPLEFKIKTYDLESLIPPLTFPKHNFLPETSKKRRRKNKYNPIQKF
jgi:hypothetical protein